MHDPITKHSNTEWLQNYIITLITYCSPCAGISYNMEVENKSIPTLLKTWAKNTYQRDTDKILHLL